MKLFRGVASFTAAQLTESWRAKPAIFWNLVFPILLLIGLSYIFGAGEAEGVQRVLPGIMTMNLIAASFFGTSFYMVSLRESGLYRRYHVTPVKSITIVTAHAITSMLNIMMAMILQVIVAKLLFGIHIQGSLLLLLLLIFVSAFAFIPLGLIIGSVARDMRIAPAISNILFFPLAFLSGAAMPLFLMPETLQRIAEFLPATYVVEILQDVIIRGVEITDYLLPSAILLLTGIIGFICSALLFRWESSQKINRNALFAVLASLLTLYLFVFLISPKLDSAKIPPGMNSETPKSGSIILKGMTVIDGLGNIINNGRIVILGDEIMDVGEDFVESAQQDVQVIDLSGSYIIPGLIDSHIHLGGSGGGSSVLAEFLTPRIVRDLQVYLAMGVTSIVSMTDDVDDLLSLRDAVTNDKMRAPRVFLSGPSITSVGGHPASIFKIMPGLAERMTRQVNTEKQAEAAVDELKSLQVNFVKLFLEAGRINKPLPLLRENLLHAAIKRAHEIGMLTTVHVDSDKNAQLAIQHGAHGIEHLPTNISSNTLEIMNNKGVTLTPTIGAYLALSKSLNGESFTQAAVKKWVDPIILDSLNAPDSWLAKVRKSEQAVKFYTQRSISIIPACRLAVSSGVTIIAGSDAGNPGSFHGIGLLNELELLVNKCGMTPMAAIMSATSQAAQRLQQTNIGQIKKSSKADLVILKQDPSRDIKALWDIREVYFRGKKINLKTLFSTHAGNWLTGMTE